MYCAVLLYGEGRFDEKKTFTESGCSSVRRLHLPIVDFSGPFQEYLDQLFLVLARLDRDGMEIRLRTREVQSVLRDRKSVV